MKIIALAAAAALALLAVPAFAQAQKSAPPKDCGPLPPVFEGLAFSGDGDTIYGVGQARSFRLWGVQAPELRGLDKAETVAGMRARAAIEDLLDAAGHKVRCEPRKWDRFCRVVASCQAGALDLSLELLKGGMAYGFWLSDTTPESQAASVAYAAAEAEARRDKRGLWGEWLGVVDLKK